VRSLIPALVALLFSSAPGNAQRCLPTEEAMNLLAKAGYMFHASMPLPDGTTAMMWVEPISRVGLVVVNDGTNMCIVALQPLDPVVPEMRTDMEPYPLPPTPGTEQYV
jgi:hypothetical protein